MNPIKHSDLIEENIFNPVIQQLTEIKTLLGEIQKIKLTNLNSLKANLSGASGNTKGGQADIAKISKVIQETSLSYKDAAKYVKLLEAEESKLNNTIGKTSAAYSRLAFETKNVLNKNSKAYKDAQSQLARYNAELKKSETAHGAWGRNVGNYLSAVRNQWFALTAAMAGSFYAVKRWINLNAELSDSLASVRRTTGMTNAEVSALNKQLRNLNTRTAQASLLDLAHVAGKLGIAKDEIFGFVKAADMIGVALGKDIGNNEEAINQLGRIVKIFKVDSGDIGMEKALLKIGSALKDLGNASVAEEINIIDFTKRLGGIASAANIPVDKIMGLAATYDILGQTMEVSSTATSQIWIAMVQKTEKMAKIAGMSVKEFSGLMKKDFNEAFIAFVEGLSKNKGGMEELGEYFKGLGLDGRRIIGVMTVLSGHIAEYRRQMVISKESLDEGTTAAKQFAIQNETLAASIDKATKAFTNFLANSGTLSVLSSMMSKFATLFDSITARFSDDKVVRMMDELRRKKVAYNLELENTNPNNPLVSRRLDIMREEISALQNTINLTVQKRLEEEKYNKLLEKNRDYLKEANKELTKKYGPEKMDIFGLNRNKKLAGVPEAPSSYDPNAINEYAKEMSDAEKEKAIAEEKRRREAYYQWLLKLDLVTFDQMFKHEKDKLIEQGIWQKAKAEEIEKWIADMKKTYLLKQMKDQQIMYNTLLANLRGAAGLEGFKGGKYQINSKGGQQGAGLMQQGLPANEGIRPFQPIDPATLEAGMNQAYDVFRGGEDDSFNPFLEWPDETQKVFDDMAEIMSGFAASAGEIMSALSNSYQVQMENEMALVEMRYQKEYDEIDRLVNGKYMSEKKGSQQKIELEKKQKAEELKIEKEYKKKQQKLAYAQALINIATGVTQALAQGGILGIIMGLAVIAAGVIQLDTISSQKFAKGGSGEVNAKGTVLKGKRHSQGGVKIPGIGEAEQGEYFAIINRKATSKYRSELPQLFEAINEGRMDQLFDKRGAGSVNVNVNDRYGREMLTEMRKPKVETKIIDTGSKIIYETGNYRLITHKQ